MREALREHEHENAAVQAIESLHDDIESDPAELQAILRSERPLHLKRRMDAALNAGDLSLYQTLLPQLAAAKASLNVVENS